MARLTAVEFREKHARRLKASIEDMRAGVQRVTESPTERAAKKQDKMLANLTRAVSSGKWAARLRKVSLEAWKDSFITKGLGRVASGIDAAGAKVEDFAGQLLAFQDGILPKIKAMPDLTLEDSISRATEWMRQMSKFQRK